MGIMNQMHNPNDSLNFLQSVSPDLLNILILPLEESPPKKIFLIHLKFIFLLSCYFLRNTIESTFLTISLSF